MQPVWRWDSGPDFPLTKQKREGKETYRAHKQPAGGKWKPLALPSPETLVLSQLLLLPPLKTQTNKKCKIEFPLCLSESKVSEWNVSVDGRERLKKGSPGFARLLVPRPESPPVVYTCTLQKHDRVQWGLNQSFSTC